MRNTAVVVCPRRSLPTCFAIDGPDGMKISSLSLLAYRMTGARFAGYAAALGHTGTLNSFKAQRQGEMTIVEKRAVILAGGRGTRLKPYTVALPKPLVPVGDKPILEIIVRQLCSHGFHRLTLAVNHQADIIRAYFGDGSKFGIAIDYSLETIPLSTMGPLLLVENLPSSFIVMNGDVLTDLDYGALLDRHEREGNLLSISAAQREQPIDFEYRADFFNLLNHTNFAVTSGSRSMNSGQFGLLSSASRFNGGDTGGPRVIQMTARFRF